MARTNDLHLLPKASEGRSLGRGQIRSDRPCHQPQFAGHHSQRVATEQNPLGFVNVGYMSGSVTGRCDRSKSPFDELAVRQPAIWPNRVRCGFLQQSAKQNEHPLLGNLFAEPPAYPTLRRPTCKARLVVCAVVNSDAIFTL